MKQKMYRFDAGDLESVDGVAEIFLWAEQLFDAINRHETSKPVPFIIVSNVEADVAVACFVSALLCR